MKTRISDTCTYTLSNDTTRILNALQDGIVISDSAGYILFGSDRYFKLSTLAPTTIIGQPAIKLVHDGLFDVVLNPEIVQGKEPATRVQQVANGRRLVLDGHPVLDDHGHVALVITFIRDASSLEEVQGHVLAQRELLESFTQIKHSSTFQAPPYIFQSSNMLRIRSQLNSVAPTDAAVLLLGETGVGKDVLARKIHQLSTRAKKEFIKVDCGSIPDNLIESELFGYEAGTFTGGLRQGKMGIFEAASHGTLFLDEIGELPLHLQNRLLRVLQDKAVLRIGAVRPRPVDVRIIAATNRNLEEEVRKSRFRQDLFYRLKVAVIEIPPLRQRIADILPLASAFLHYYDRKYRREHSFSPKAEEALLAHPWPGNIRELENLIQSCVVQNRNFEISAADLSLSPAGLTVMPPSPPVLEAHTSYKQAMEQFEYSLLSNAVTEHGSLSRAAAHLRIDRSTLFRKLKAFSKCPPAGSGTGSC